jgi:bifunctional DNA-binding transcriptional regulator/antitoxin component of YhaV-PrlF toxin-antitoxin module
MEAVILGKAGQVSLPRDILKASRIKAGAKLSVVARAGQIILSDRTQLRSRMDEIDQEMRAHLRETLARGGTYSFFGGLTLEEYLALSEEEDKALWDQLNEEAEREVKSVEREIPPHFVPAGQRRP